MPPPHRDLLISFPGAMSKDEVYNTPGRDLRERIMEAIESISEDMLQCTWQEIVYRLDIMTVTAGVHIEMW